jgi:hypothetical protein
MPAHSLPAATILGFDQNWSSSLAHAIRYTSIVGC